MGRGRRRRPRAEKKGENTVATLGDIAARKRWTERWGWGSSSGRDGQEVPEEEGYHHHHHHRRSRLAEAVDKNDAKAIAELCVGQGGLAGDDALRAMAWQVLLTEDAFEKQPPGVSRGRRSQEALVKDCNMDIERSMFNFRCCKSLSAKKRLQTRGLLLTLVTGVLGEEPSLYYYQGFHDICTIFQHTFQGLSEKQKLEATRRASLQIFADHHQSDFSTTIQVMELLMLVLRKFDPELHDLIDQAGVGPMFALSWVITGFAHSIEDVDVVKRLYDAFLAAHPMLVIYTSVAMLRRPHTRARILRVGKEDPDSCMAILHHTLQNVAEPCIFSTKSWKRHAKQLRKKQRKSRVHGQGSIVQGRHIPSSKREDQENDVDSLVKTAFAMMALFPPDKVCAEYKRLHNKGIPGSSVMTVPTSQKRHWAAALSTVEQSDEFCREQDSLRKLASNGREKNLRQRVRLFLGVATMVGVTAVASSWASQGAMLE